MLGHVHVDAGGSCELRRRQPGQRRADNSLGLLYAHPDGQGSARAQAVGGGDRIGHGRMGGAHQPGGRAVIWERAAVVARVAVAAAAMRVGVDGEALMPGRATVRCQVARYAAGRVDRPAA